MPRACHQINVSTCLTDGTAKHPAARIFPAVLVLAAGGLRAQPAQG